MLGDCGRVAGSALQCPAKLQKRVIFIRTLQGSRSLPGREEKRRVGKGKEGKRERILYQSVQSGESNYLSYFNLKTWIQERKSLVMKL